MTPQSQSVESLAEEFLLRLRRGEKPSVNEYTLRYPTLAREIRECFPALRMVENFKPDSRDDAASGRPSGPSVAPPPLPSRLGDFHIVREIGRGGMGVVYEAVQESLGRPVALKVLPLQALADDAKRKRFEREARTAARLHHTNIVPVFGVGEHDGVHYYAMQFINGLGLDKVLSELRRMRIESSPLAGRDPPTPSAAAESAGSLASDPSNDSGSPWSAAVVAQSLADGSFGECRVQVPLTVEPNQSGEGAASAERLTAAVDTQAKSLSDTASFTLPGPKGDLSGRRSWSAYWESVARIGVQAAEALQYAHDHGVLHRDVKPSNLLLDARGTVWVTDFGLAKADDHDDLTHSGDLLGTLRYMAPEMFSGKADGRSDVYSLGLTLYELLAMRPAFDETLRHKLIRQVLHDSPPRLRALDRRIPRDLETIVHKSIERDLSHRYASAAELGSDLQRFLRDEPIRARPLSAVSRCFRWCWRNPRTALLASAIALLLVVVGIGGIAWAIQAESARRRIAQAEAQRRDAEVTALVEEAQRLSSGPFPNFARAIELLTTAIDQRPQDAQLLLFRGSARYERGQYADAISDLERSLELEPRQNPAAHWLLAMAWQQQGNEARAREQLEHAQRQQPDDVKSLVVQALAMPFDQRGIDLLTQAIDGAPFDPLLHFYRGRIAYNVTVRRTAARHFRLAVDDLELALRNRPHDPRIIETLSRCLAEFYFLANDGQRALARCEELLGDWLAIRPNDPDALAVLAKYELSSERPAQAVEVCLRAKGSGAKHRELLFHLGWGYRDLAKHERAVEAFSEAIALRAEPAVTGELLVASYAARAYSLAALGRSEQAELDLKRALNVAPPQSWLLVDWYSVISAHRQLGRLDEGLNWCQRMCQVVPDCGTTWYLRANLLEDLQRDREAREDFIKTLELNPGYDGAYIRLLNSFLQAGETEAALQWCDRWLAVKPEFSTALRWHGMLTLLAGRPEQSLTSLSQALQLDAADARAYYFRARAYVALKQFELAAKDFDQALKLDPNDVEVYESRGILHFGRGRYAEAADDFSEVLKARHGDAEVWRRRGDAFRRLGRFPEALADLDRAIELNGGDATAYDRRGLVYAALQRQDEALADFARALEINPREPWTRRHVVDVRMALKDYRGTAEFCRQWAQAAPADSEPHRLSALALLSDGDHQAALNELAAAAAKNAQDADVPLLRGRVYAALGQHAKALADFNVALELKPGYEAVYYSRGLAHAALRRYPAAMADFTRALSKNPRDGWLYYHRANAYRHQRQYDQALADADRAVECDARIGTFAVMRGRILAVQGRFQEALAAFERAFDLNEEEPFLRHAVVTILCSLGRFDDAKSFCDRWIADEPMSAEAIRHRAFVFDKLGQYETAIAEFNAALAQSPKDYVTLYYRGRSYLAMHNRQRGEADIAQSLVICPESKSAEHHAAVGEYFGQRGEWQLAAANLAKAVELDPVDARRMHLLALVQLAQGDEPAYRQTVSRMLKQYALTGDPNAAELVALTGGLRKMEGDSEPWIALANLAVENRPDSASCRCALGAILYRAGHARDALPQLELAQRLADEASADSTTIAAWASYLTVLARRELGNSAAAAASGDRAPRELDTPPDVVWASYIEPPPWSRRLIAELLRREAMSDRGHEGETH